MPLRLYISVDVGRLTSMSHTCGFSRATCCVGCNNPCNSAGHLSAYCLPKYSKNSALVSDVMYLFLLPLLDLELGFPGLECFGAIIVVCSDVQPAQIQLQQEHIFKGTSVYSYRLDTVAQVLERKSAQAASNPSDKLHHVLCASSSSSAAHNAQLAVTSTCVSVVITII